jgi:hypothetical protein
VNELSLIIWQRQANALSSHDFRPFTKGEDKVDCISTFRPSSRKVKAFSERPDAQAVRCAREDTVGEISAPSRLGLFCITLQYKSGCASVWFVEVDERYSRQTCIRDARRSPLLGNELSRYRSTQCYAHFDDIPCCRIERIWPAYGRAFFCASSLSQHVRETRAPVPVGL